MSKSHNLQFRNHLVALGHLNSGIVDQLVNNSLGRLLLVDHSSGLAHQVRTGVVDRVVINVIRKVFKVMLDRNDTLGGQLLDIRGAVFFPVLNVGVLADTERTTLDQVSDESQKSSHQGMSYSKDNGANRVIKAGSANSLLVSLRSTGLISQDEAGTDPDGGSAQHQSGSNGLTVEQTTSRNDLHRQAGQGALLALAQLGNGRNEDSGGDITSVSTTLTTLGADDICASVQRLLNVLGVTDHVHVEDARVVKFVNNVLWRNTDSRDEELSAALDNNVDKFIQLSFGVVITKKCKIC